MPGPSLQTDVVVLAKSGATESFETLTVFSPEHGLMRLLHRVPRKASSTHVALDLFDEASVWLDSGSQGTWFVREVRLAHRHTGIGQDYARLREACAFARLPVRNPTQEESRPALHQLLRTALQAFATADRPDVVGFKSLYCFARDEGHPLKQQWFPTLPAEDREAVTELLNRPVAEQTADRATVRRLYQRLAEYLQGHTEILVD